MIHCSPAGQGFELEHPVGSLILEHPDLYGSPDVPPGHWQVKDPGSLLQTAPDGQGFPAHSSISIQPELEVMNPELHIHLASWFIKVHCSCGPQSVFSHGSINNIIRTFHKLNSTTYVYSHFRHSVRDRGISFCCHKLNFQDSHCYFHMLRFHYT